MPSMKREAFDGRKRYGREGWKKDLKRRAVQRDKLKGREGEGSGLEQERIE